MQKKFKLQKVLEYRKLMLEREKSSLAALRKQERELLEKMNFVNNIIKDKERELEQSSRAGEFEFIPLYEKYINTLVKAKKELNMGIVDIRKKVAAQNNVTVTAFKRKSIMDKLSERHKEEYKTYVEKQEANVIEDIVLTRKASKINSGEEL